MFLASLSLRHDSRSVNNGSPLSIVDLASSPLHLGGRRAGLEEVDDGMVAVVDSLGVWWVGGGSRRTVIGYRTWSCGCRGLEGGLVGCSLGGGWMGGLVNYPL